MEISLIKVFGSNQINLKIILIALGLTSPLLLIKESNKMTDAIKADLLSANQLFAIANNCPTDRLTVLLPYLNEVMHKSDITSKARKAHFLAQVAHESDGLNTNEEYADGSDYEGRVDLGNVETGDGIRFKG